MGAMSLGLYKRIKFAPKDWLLLHNTRISEAVSDLKIT